MARFNVIGRHDRREEAIQKLGFLVGGTFETDIRENVTQPTQERQAVECNASLPRMLEDILAEDIRFYERWAR